MAKKKKYHVQVQIYYSVLDIIEVEAASEAEAKELAEEQSNKIDYVSKFIKDPDLLCHDDTTTEILKIEGGK